MSFVGVFVMIVDHSYISFGGDQHRFGWDGGMVLVKFKVSGLESGLLK